ncbi:MULTISPECIES: Acg family FMN-binding oxidoreductase [Alphaproteobacteria]|uniref:Tat pathway signal protein n=2 Tax=Alphaproteobacteria TaxID=28211 RepID=A0A512HGP0_9HYPH|nr:MULTISPECIES: Tat pathway signal protein [Alphaproteobacteria]GEO84601.1 Tat pathway signal protein [Ciceribacter naphthalenivorans]GLR22564.1 Tat pathway signal protein [Ciceribacter naphthalenivorans]GLT05420.1 Tat pathway signal protein [Sphingomonas psychrolutea]
MLNRRGILIGGAAVLAAGGAGAVLSTKLATERYAEFARRLRKPLTQSAGPSELIRYATLAPNGHNTQPWLFRQSARGIAILPDVSRRTPVVDPDDHHLYVSLGCAIENLAVAARATGQSGDVVIDGEEGASFSFSALPGTVDPATAELFQAIPLRQSTRSLYDGRAVASDHLRRLSQSAVMDGVDVALVTERSTIDRVRDLVIAGNDVQMDDPAFMRELKDWLRFSPSTAMTRGDGLYAPTSGNPALPEWLGSIAFDLAFKSASEADKYARHMDSSAGVAVFSAVDEGPAGWIAVGRACQRLCLMATALGLKTAFVNQPVEVASLRGEMASLAGFPGRRPDLVLRFGQAPPMVYSPRRPVDAVVTTS